MRALLLLATLAVAVPVAAQPPQPCPSEAYQPLLANNAGTQFWTCQAGAWVAVSLGGGGVPTGTITVSLSACAAGFEEVADLAGKALVGTLAANKDVGTTGGSDAITPAGTNSAPAFTGTPSTTVVNHVHTLATGTGTTGNFAQVIGTVDTTSGGTGGTPTQTALGTLSGNPTAGGAASYTPADTVAAPTFTGTQFDNRSAFTRVIFCRKT